MDFKSLYDSLSPDIVKQALHHAMSTCRSDWSDDFKEWIVELVDMSIRSSVGKYKGTWYLQKNGIPTGGGLCVQLANIAVFYIMNKAVYSNSLLMSNVIDIRRYIDDGTGFYKGTARQFKFWLNEVNESLKQYGLNIDEYDIKEPGEYVHFLDIKFCFDSEGLLQTDLYVKETDSRSYLHFSSAHPNHVFSGIIYSQCLRLRRRINSDTRLNQRINELKLAFKAAGYPEKMIENISKKVMDMNRDISEKVEVVTDLDNTQSIRIVSTFGADKQLTNSISSTKEDLLLTRSFSKCTKPLFSFVKKTAASIRSRVSTVKDQALGGRIGTIKPCEGRGCKCCKMLGDKLNFKVNGKRVTTAPGTCKSYNVVYLAKCRICSKPYTGRTIDPLHIRVNNHRAKFNDIVNGKVNPSVVEDEDDLFSLGLHLYVDHNLQNHEEFDKNYQFSLLQNCSPSIIEVKEHIWIHELQTLYPRGLNRTNPFAIPIL